MSTRSMIAQVNADNTGKQIFCNFDSYLQWNGFMLHEHYDTPRKVKELMLMGNISSLRSTIKETVFFIRDMGRYWKQDTFKEFTLNVPDDGELNYSNKIFLPLLSENEHGDTEFYYMFYKDVGWLVAPIPVKREHYPQTEWSLLSEALKGKTNFTVDPENND